MGDSITYSQTTKAEAAKGQAKWLALALLAVLLTAIIVVHFSRTPTTTRADNRNVADEFGFVPLQQQRDLGKAQAYYDSGVVYCKAGAFDSAISDFNKAIEINPRESQYYYYRGVTYAAKDEFNKAWKDVHKAQDLGYQVSPEVIEQLRNLITLKRESGPDFPQRTSRTPATRTNTPKIDPGEIVKQNLEQLKSTYKNKYEAIKKQMPPGPEFSRVLVGMQAEYDQAKAKLIEIQSQFKLIDDLVKSGQMDSDAGYKAKMKLAVPKAVFDAMFP
jgi:tetratricopeptide (TPR) repeat protein